MKQYFTSDLPYTVYACLAKGLEKGLRRSYERSKTPYYALYYERSTKGLAPVSFIVLRKVYERSTKGLTPVSFIVLRKIYERPTKGLTKGLTPGLKINLLRRLNDEH